MTPTRALMRKGEGVNVVGEVEGVDLIGVSVACMGARSGGTDGTRLRLIRPEVPLRARDAALGETAIGRTLATIDLCIC